MKYLNMKKINKYNEIIINIVHTDIDNWNINSEHITNRI